MPAPTARLLALAALAIAIALPASLLAQQAHINLDWAPHRAAGTLVPFMANVISPEVNDQRMVTFRVKAPRAQEVQLAAGTIAAALGSATSTWPFTKGADGTWTLTMGPVPQNIYVYKFLIDGVSVVDPNNTLGGFGNQPGYSTLVVHGDRAGVLRREARAARRDHAPRLSLRPCSTANASCTSTRRRATTARRRTRCCTCSAAAASWRRAGGSTDGPASSPTT